MVKQLIVTWKEGELTMRAVICFKMVFAGLVLSVLLAGCSGPAGTGDGKKMPLVFETNFEDGSLDAWQAAD